MDVDFSGTQPLQSKNEAFSKLEQSNTWGDLRILIGLFVFYKQLLPLYEMYIRPWRYILLTQPQPGTIYQKNYTELMQNICTPGDQRLLERLKKEIISGPTLARPEPSQRFYINTDLSKDGIGAVLLQVDDSVDARKSEAKEKDD